jgi:hypothetical protein
MSHLDIMSSATTNELASERHVRCSKVPQQVTRSNDRQPTPQFTHLDELSASNRYCIVSEHGSGYEALEFEGKDQQMER